MLVHFKGNFYDGNLDRVLFPSNIKELINKHGLINQSSYICYDNGKQILTDTTKISVTKGERIYRFSIGHTGFIVLVLMKNDSYRILVYSETDAWVDEGLAGLNQQLIPDINQPKTLHEGFYEARVHELELQNMTTSDAQAAVDYEVMLLENLY